MNTHDIDIELPPLPQGEYRLSPDSLAPTLYDEEAMEAYTRAAIETDRKRRSEPVAWRYTDARGHFRYRGYVADFDKFYPMLKPEPLYAAPQPADEQQGEVVVTKDESGYIVAVTRQDDEGRILSAIAEADRQHRREPVAWQNTINGFICKQKTENSGVSAASLHPPHPERPCFKYQANTPDRQEQVEAAENLAPWLSAALDDPAVCAEYKAAINRWFDAGPPGDGLAVFKDLSGMSAMNRTISYAAAYKLRELGYEWDSQELQWTGAPAVPDGWKLVPEEVTDAMAVAAIHEALKYKPHQRPLNGTDVWKAMLAAAPSPTEKEKPHD